MRVSLSKRFLSLSPSTPPLPFLSPNQIWTRLGSRGLVPSLCRMSSFKWLIMDFPYTLSIYHGFSFNGMMPCVSCESHLAHCLTHSQLDMWLILSYSNVPSVPHRSRCLEKLEIPTVSEFDEIRHDFRVAIVIARFRKTIPTVKSISSSDI